MKINEILTFLLFLLTALLIEIHLSRNIISLIVVKEIKHSSVKTVSDECLLKQNRNYLIKFGKK